MIYPLLRMEKKRIIVSFNTFDDQPGTPKELFNFSLPVKRNKDTKSVLAFYILLLLSFSMNNKKEFDKGWVTGYDEAMETFEDLMDKYYGE